jgi:signal transduction histidine kinase/predicted hydrocarbon binding protein
MEEINFSQKLYKHVPSMLSIPELGQLEVGLSRMCLLDITGGFLTLREGLWNEVGIRARDIFYGAGIEGAKSFLEKLIEAKQITPDESGLKEALAEYSSAGFGVYSLIECDLQNGYIKVLGSNCFEAWGHKEKKLLDHDTVCDYSRGVIAGFMMVIESFVNPEVAKDLYCVENKCSVKNHEFCSFVVAPSSKLLEEGLKIPKQTQPLKYYLKAKTNSLQRTLKRLKAIEDISSACSSLVTSDLSNVSNMVLASFCELTGADYGVLFLMDGPDKTIRLDTAYGFPNSFVDTYNSFKFTLDGEAVNESWPSVRSILNKQLVLIKDSAFTKVNFSKFFIDSVKPNKVMAVASVPLIVNGRAIGAITKYYIKHHDFDDEEISFMKTTANIISSTLERNHLLDMAKKTEKDLAHANEGLKHTNQELDSFVYISSHDLREPLRTIESFVGIVQDQLNKNLTDDQNDYFQRIVKATHRMRSLIEDLTNLSRASRGSKEKENKEVDLNVLLMEVQFELTAFVEKNNAKILLLDKLPNVMGSKEKISSVFKNLIANGIKFNTSRKKEIKIYISEDLNFDPKKLCICVEDNGVGINKDYHKKIFDLFQRLHSQDEYEGTGAGLAIVKKILEKYGCEIWIDSKEGNGSKFYFTLPRYDSNAEYII